MVKTTYGILGKDIGVSDKTCGLKKIDSKIVVDYVKKGTILIPDFQRELQQDKIEEITKEFIHRHKNNENFLIKHGYTVSVCKIGSKKELYLIDGQHRLESIKMLCSNGYNPEIIIRVQICDNIEQMKHDFKLLNCNSNMPFLYTCFENDFLQNMLIELKNLIKKDYKKCFNQNKNNKNSTSNRIHIDSFIELFEIDKVKKITEKKNVSVEDLYSSLMTLNEEIKDIFDNLGKQEKNYYINTKDNRIVTENNFYLSLKNINWIDKFFGIDQDYNFEAINYKKAKIPKSLSVLVYNRDFGPLYIGKCFVCESEINRDNSHLGHIEPEYMGGETILDNLKAICPKCNLSMGTQNLNDFKQVYFK